MRRLCAWVALGLALASGVGAAQKNGDGSEAARLLPPPEQVLTAAREYPVTTAVSTSHAGWVEMDGCANVGQELKVDWHIDRGGEAVLQARDAWNPASAWQELGRWGMETSSKERGETTFRVERPTQLRLRARGPRFPHSGVAALRARYVRHTVAVLRGNPRAERKPVILAEGYDPFNTQDWNDPTWQTDPTLAGLIAEGHRKYGLSAWVVDWGDGGASLTEQAADFEELARAINGWNSGKNDTVAVGISMGAITVRCALAEAASQGNRLGVRKCVSINGPHQGAWVSPKLIKILMKRADGSSEPEPGSEAAFLRRAVGSPAAQELLMDGERHEAFYRHLRSMGSGGYAPGVSRVAFSNGTLAKDGTELADFVKGRADVIHRVRLRPLWLPIWVTVAKIRREFKYGGYPGELLPTSLQQPVRGHVRFLGIFRFDFRAGWESIPTYIPTHSALDFPEDLVSGDQMRQYRYSQWKRSAFERIYVARGRNLAHDETQVDWIDPRTGKPAPGNENAVLYEISH